MLSQLSQDCLFATAWTIALQAPLFIEFSGQEYWSGLHFLLHKENIPQQNKGRTRQP